LCPLVDSVPALTETVIAADVCGDWTTRVTLVLLVRLPLVPVIVTV
jgi:hypothetical protein